MPSCSNFAIFNGKITKKRVKCKRKACFSFHIPSNLFLQCTHRIEDGKDGDTDISEDGEPHGGETEGGKDKDGDLNADSKPYVLTGDAEGTAGNADGKGYLRGMVVHQYHVGSLDGCVTAQSSHGDTDIGTGKDGSVVDTVTDE